MVLSINTKDAKMVEVSLKTEQKIVDLLTDENEHGSEVLLPLIVRILKKNNLSFRDLTGVEVETGPGSYTGLRVGAAVGQALSFSLNIPLNGQIGKPVDLQYT